MTLSYAALAASAAGQSLGDLAKQTEERRKTSPAESIVIRAGAPRDNGPLRLTHDVLSRYRDARLALADLRRADRTLDRRLYKGKSQARHYDDLVPVYGGEEGIVALFSTFGLTATEYLQIEVAMWRGEDYARYPQLNKGRLSPRDQENNAFVKANRSLVQQIKDQCKAAEHGLAFWGVIPSYY